MKSASLLAANWSSNGMNVVVEGLMTSYQKAGKGKVIVCLHGWGDSALTFSKLTEILQQEYEVISVDLPGIGQTQMPENAWGLDDYAQFVKAWLNKLGITEVYGLIGHSNGGAIAMRLVAKGILKPKKLILLASAGIRNNHKVKKSLLKAVSRTGKVVTAPLPGHSRAKIRNRFYKRIGSEVGLLPHMEDTFRKIVTEDTQEDAKKIATPTLLIYGTADKSTPLSYGQTFQRLIKNSKLQILSTGHMIHQEESGAVASLIGGFLE